MEQIQRGVIGAIPLVGTCYWQQQDNKALIDTEKSHLNADHGEANGMP